MLSSMVMLGLQRIVIRHGRLRATMGFHIDATDRAHAEQASTFDIAHQHSVSGFFYVAFSAKTSVAYVSSQKSDSDSAINVQADLTGEVDLTFETDYLPLNRLARAEFDREDPSEHPEPGGQRAEPFGQRDRAPRHRAERRADRLRPDHRPWRGAGADDLAGFCSRPPPTPRPAAAPARRWARSPEAEDEDARGPAAARPAARPVRGPGRA